MNERQQTRRDLLALGASSVVVSSSGCLGNILGPADPEQRTINLNESGTLLAPSSPTPGDAFGTTAALSGNTILIGSSKVSGYEPNPVSVFTKTNGTWSRVQKLTPPTKSANHRFGDALALHENRALVVERNEPDGESPTKISIHSYTKKGNQWTHEGIIWNAPPVEVPLLPCISLSDGTALIGNPNTQRVHYFKRTARGWTRITEFTPSKSTTKRYGISVDLSPTDAIIGASQQSTTGEFAGGVYHSHRRPNNWSKQSLISPQEGDAKDAFGWSVALADSHLLVSAPGDEDPNGDSAGSAYLYSMTDSGIEKEQKLWAADGNKGHRYGVDVAIGSGVSIVGADQALTEAGERAGAAYLRKASDNWNTQYKLTDPHGMPTDRLGLEVDTDGSHAIVTAFNHRGTTAPSEEDVLNKRPGAVFVLNLSDT